MNLRLTPRRLGRWLQLLLGLGLIWWVAQYYYHPHYSSGFRHECAVALNLTYYQQFQFGGHDPKKWQPCRWSGKIALVELNSSESVDAHPAKNYLRRDLAAHTEGEASVVGFVAEARKPSTVVGKMGGMLFVVLAEARSKGPLGVVVVREWANPPTDADFASEYPNLARRLEELHDR